MQPGIQSMGCELGMIREPQVTEIGNGGVSAMEGPANATDINDDFEPFAEGLFPFLLRLLQN